MHYIIIYYAKLIYDDHDDNEFIHYKNASMNITYYYRWDASYISITHKIITLAHVSIVFSDAVMSK